MVSSGMVAAGYKLVLFDDCWSATTRDPTTGSLQADPARFPSGIPALVAYLEARGMYLGMYTSAGNQTCKGGRPGSMDHYAQDALTILTWGARYIKADNCETNHSLAPHQYMKAYSDAINATGTPASFALCEWGEDNVWTWGPNVSQVFRVNNDHLPLWTFNGQGTADIIEKMAMPEIAASLAPFSFPDPDFLMTGFWPLTDTESETEFAFWALFGGPMIISTDVRNMSAWKAGVVLNADILAVNQDAAVLPGTRVVFDNVTNTQVWKKPLANGDLAVIAYNKDDASNRTVAVNWVDLGWPASASVSVYDLWSHTVIGTFTGGTTAADIVPHGHVMWRLTRKSV
jgi:alpha-galactosidase